MKIGDGRENPRRNAFLSSLGLESGLFIGPDPAHSKKVVFVRKPQDARGFKADGVYTDQGDCVLGVTVADCMPIWLQDRRRGAFGVLHSGWQGTGICIEALNAFRAAFGSSPSDIDVILGPSIGACCYAVGPERALQYMQEFGPQAAVEREGQWYLDMAQANQGILREAGVESIAVVDSCTACDAQLGSSRRQGRSSFTRMLAGISTRIPLDRKVKNR
jgi:YfiH family protein